MAGTPRSAKSVVATFLSIGLVLVVAASLVPAPPPGEVGGADDADALEHKVDLMRDANRRGVAGYQLLTEREVNAYLQRLVKATAGRDDPAVGMNLAFTPDVITVQMTARRGPLRLTLEARGEPAFRSQGFAWETRGGRMGLLPLPAFAGKWVEKRVVYLFSRMSRERNLLKRLVRCKVEEQAVHVALGQPSEEAP